jgi:hypothetical protein
MRARLPLAVTRVWLKRGPSVEVHLGQLGQACDFRKSETLVLFVQKASAENAIEPSASLISIE